MSEQSPDYKKLFFEEQRRREEEQRRREEEQRRREAAESVQKEDQRIREEVEKKIRKTTLPEFLDACHNHLHSGLTVQTDATLSTRGDPANANHKLRPERLLAWEDFPEEQAAIWDHLIESDFVQERHFTSLHTLEESGEAIRRRMMSSELDLHLFQRSTVEDHVSSIIERLYNEPILRRKFGLNGSVKFENHANTLSPESQLEEGMEQMIVSGTRRSSRLLAKAKGAQLASVNPILGEGAAPRALESAPSSRPRADQFCVYNINTQDAGNRVAAFIVEYKAPHKLPLGRIYEGLEDMELDDVILSKETETPRDQFRRLVAAVITQAFSYMVKIRSEYGCVCTGEATIFLRIPDDPRTVYYFLSVPKGDVGETTGWTSELSGTNRLHLTAVGQMLAFTLQAMRTPLRSNKWRADATSQLNSWEVVFEDLVDKIPENDGSSSEYRPPRHDEFLRMSPIQLRRRHAPISSPSCAPQQGQHAASDEEPESDTPSRRRLLPRRQPRTRATASPSPSQRSHGQRGWSGQSEQGEQRGQSEQYCIQNCLLGLVNGGPLDMSCPNVQHHGESHHQIDRPTFLARIRQQLSDDLDTNFKPASLPGACGVLFQVRLKSHGYVVAAKCTPSYFVHRLQHEAVVYDLLRPIQGVHVPVHLGNIDLATPYDYEGICELVHMMFLSFGGRLISKHLTAQNKPFLAQQLDCSAQAIHNLGVLHRDLMPRNMLWNEETGRVMVIDFERAELVEPRTVLGVISANQRRKRKREFDVTMAKQGGSGPSIFLGERRRAAMELHGLVR